MDQDKLRRLLQRVRNGRLPVDRALRELRGQTLAELGYATVDLQRALRTGFPEVVFGPGKTPEQIAGIVARLRDAGQTVLVTRVGPEAAEVVSEVAPEARYHEQARAVVVRRGRPGRGKPGVLVITAGTSDLPVAAEAALTAEVMGSRVERVDDVGVAGVHRLLEHREQLLQANVIVAVAGMEGALPSVIAGLTDCPVIGVPTDVGYGIGGDGEAALLAMLNSCASGLTVVNVNNGFGAGYTAALINHRSTRRRAGR